MISSPRYSNLVNAGYQPAVLGSLPSTSRRGAKRTVPVSREITTKLLSLSILAFTAAYLASCSTADTQHRIVVSVPEQRLALLDRGRPIATYPISTSKFGVGDIPGSSGTPLGEMEIAKKIGTGANPGTVFHDRRPTGEIVAPDSPGRDPIVSRILWLRGRETQNANAFGRYIYIHGTAEERNIGSPVSYGCVRMRSADVIQLYDVVGQGAQVSIVDGPLDAFVSGVAPATHTVPVRRIGGQITAR